MIPNKYPAVVRPDGRVEPQSALAAFPSRRRPLQTPEDFFAASPGDGVHEVIIESPEHKASFADLTPEQASWSFVAYRDRLSALSSRAGIRYGMLFKNCGGAGGATLEHTHSQLIGTQLVPVAVERELQTSADYYAKHTECIFCSLTQAELDANSRIVAATEKFVAYCPFAGRFPYETWIVPRRHEPHFISASLEELDELSGLFRRILRALEKIVPQVPYNFWIHTSPFDTFPYDHYHWHIELIPRISTQAGFEWGTGCFVNSVVPEDAATELRIAFNDCDQSVLNR